MSRIVFKTNQMIKQVQTFIECPDNDVVTMKYIQEKNFYKFMPLS